MAKLTEQDFYFGVGLAALFKYNPYIMPSLIENVTDTKLKGKKIKITKGIFYKLHTLQNGEAIIYIKYTDRKITNKENIGLWKFSLSDIEKNKIDVQRKNVIPFYMVLICVDTNDISNSEVAVLTEAEYLEINDRSSIEI
ncbi:hypothetical protein [Clostridium tyrobutyricum]|uniref:hypothetical protein n=1 Tax=Clostridium tyrobutyricum TaxID=1519 RepID=UPI0010AAB7D7|nr:hypothetical protein [Clostridium tyrobutyricum]QCH27777.1 hypothetical protein EZN00_01375 [Clostridium tyrobutyricum]